MHQQPETQDTRRSAPRRRSGVLAGIRTLECPAGPPSVRVEINAVRGILPRATSDLRYYPGWKVGAEGYTTPSRLASQKHFAVASISAAALWASGATRSDSATCKRNFRAGRRNPWCFPWCRSCVSGAAEWPAYSAKIRPPRSSRRTRYCAPPGTSPYAPAP